MITQNNTVKVQTEIDVNVAKAIFKKAIVMMRAFIIAGGAGVGALFVALLVIMIKELPYEDMVFAILLCFGAVLGAGIGLKIIVSKNVKQATIEKAVNEYEFFKDCIYATVIKNGEVVTTSKICYTQLKKLKTVNGYLLLYISANTALPVLKSDITDKESNTIYAALNLPHGEDIIALPQFQDK